MLEAILNQPGAVGVNIFYGIDKEGNNTPVLVGVNAKGDHLINITTVGASGELVKQKGIVATGVLSTGTGPHSVDEGWF